MKEIKVLNVAQPNAHKIIFCGKNVENRSVSSDFRGTIAIYASKTCKNHFFEDQGAPEVKKEECEFGCIIGLVDVVDCITEDEVSPSTKQWFQGAYGYVLENPMALKAPVLVSPPKGAVIWWTLSGPKVTECLGQVGKRTITPVKSFKKPKSGPKPKLAGKTKLIPSKALSKIIGPELTTYKKAARAVIAYMDENNLYSGTRENPYIAADQVLMEVFGKRKVRFDDFKDLILKNLDVDN